MKMNISFEKFSEYNFALYDQILFSDYKSFLEEKNINYKTLAVDLFGGARNSPILVSLNNVSMEDKEELYNYFFIEKETNYRYTFDRMNVFQNVIKTNLNMDEFSEILTKMMIYRGGYLFRYYDPRVILHLIIVRSKEIYIEDKNLRIWSDKYFKNIESVILSLWGVKFIYNNKNTFSNNLKTNINIKDIDLLNGMIKKKGGKYLDHLTGEQFFKNFKVTKG